MGTVTNLADFRNKKSTAALMRPMTHEEWADFVTSSGINIPQNAMLNTRQHAEFRCLKIAQELYPLGLTKRFGRFRFSHAFQRGLLHTELRELINKYHLNQFNECL